MGTPLATAFIRIRPETSGFRAETEKSVLADMERVGDRAGKTLGASLIKSLGETLKASAAKTGKTVASDFVRAFNAEVKDAGDGVPVGPTKTRARRQGTESGGSWAEGFKRKVGQAAKQLPPIRVGAATTEAEQQLKDLSSRLRELADTEIGVDLDAASALAEVRLLEVQLEDLAERATDIDVQADTRAALKKLAELTKAAEQVKAKARTVPIGPDKTRSAKEGRETAGAYADSFRQKLEQAAKALPPITVGVAKTAAEQQLRDLSAQLRELSNKTIGVDVDAAAAVAEVRSLRSQLVELAANSPDIQVRADTAAALAKLAQVTSQADRLNGRTVEFEVQADTDRAGDRVTSFATRASETLGRLFSGNSAVASTFFQTMAQSAVQAGGQITTSVVGAAASAAVLTAATGGLNVAVGVASTAFLITHGTVIALTAAFLALAPVVSSIGGLLGAATTLAIGAAAGFAVFKLGLGGIGDSLKAMSAAQDDASGSSTKLANTQSAIASASDQVRSALAAQANTRATVAEAARRAAQQIADAERAVGQARQEAARSAKDAQERIAEAAQRARDAQQTLTASERAALDVRKELTRAQTEARENLEDLASSVKSNATDQRQAVLDVAEAKAALDKVLADKKATAAQREQAQITYDRQVQQMQDLQTRGKRLAAEQADANRKGVQGSNQVVAARKRIADADESVAAARRGLQDAQKQARKAEEQAERDRIAGQDRIAATERALADARRAQATQQRQGAFQLAQASQAVTAAQRALGQASVKTGQQGSAALKKLGDQMSKLSPNAQRLVRTLDGLKGPFGELKKFVQDRLLDGVSGQVQTLADRWLKPLRQILGDLAGRFNVVGDGLFKAFGRQDFIDNIKTAVGGFGDMIDRIGRSLPGFVDAFGRLGAASTPVLEMLGELIGGILDKFSRWIKSADDTGKLDTFMQEAAATLQQIFDIGGLVFGIIGQLIEIFFPQSKKTSDGVLDGVENSLRKISDWLKDPENQQKLRDFVQDIQDFINKVNNEWIPKITEWVGKIDGWIAGAERWIVKVKVFGSAISGFFSDISTAVSDWWGRTRDTFTSARTWLTVTLPGGFTALRDRAGARFSEMRDRLSVGWNALRTGLFAPLRSTAADGTPTSFALMRDRVSARFSEMRSRLSGIWTGIRDSVFAPLRTAITSTIPNAFKTGVDAMRIYWSRLRDVAKVPVSFVVNSVLNPFIGGINRVGAAVGMKEIIEPIRGFASGGKITGPGGFTDNRQAMVAGLGPVQLMGGEFVVNREDTAKALPLLRWVNAGMKGGADAIARYLGRPVADRPGDGSEGWAFKDGGLIGWAKDVWGAISNPTDLIKKPFQAALRQIPGSGKIKDFLTGAANRLLDGALGWMSRLGGSGGGLGDTNAGGRLGAARAFVQAQAGKPYIWAGAGPQGFDCSGIVSAAYNVLKGRNPHSHTFSTGSLPGPFFDTSRKVGPLVAGWSHPGQRGASPGIGHMAGQIAGMPFESRGGEGVVIGKRATKVGSFANIGAVRLATGGRVPSFPIMDTGGWLAPGWNPPIYNGTGRPETVTPAPTMDQVIARLERLIAAVEKVAPGVVAGISGGTRRAVQTARTTPTMARG